MLITFLNSLFNQVEMPTLLTSSNDAYEIEHGEVFYLSCYMFITGVPSCIGLRLKCGDYFDMVILSLL